MFKQIVVPLDGSHRAEQAISVAASVARATRLRWLALALLQRE